MTTTIGTGYSDTKDGREAGREAARQAVAAMKTRGGNGGADMVFVFAATNYRFADLLKGIRETTNNAQLIGSSTAGQFTQDRWGPESVAVMAVKSDSIRFHTALGTGVKG